jgi:hypothetical protein
VKKAFFPRFFHIEKKQEILFSTVFPRKKSILRHSFPQAVEKLCGKCFSRSNG